MIGVHILIQSVGPAEEGVPIDFETDDVEAELHRLEGEVKGG